MIELRDAWQEYVDAVQLDAATLRTWLDGEDPPPVEVGSLEDEEWLTGVLLECLDAMRTALQLRQAREDLRRAQAEVERLEHRLEAESRRRRPPTPALPPWCHVRRPDALAPNSPWRAYLPRRARPAVSGRRAR